MQAAFLGEGLDTDYMVSDLFAHDFKYNRFNLTSPKADKPLGKDPKPKVYASRRRLDQRNFHIKPEWLSAESAVSIDV